MVQLENETPQPKKVHPFFAKEVPDVASPSPQITPSPTIASHGPQSADSSGGSGSRKRRNEDNSYDTPAPQEIQASKKPRQKRKSVTTSLNGSITTHLNRPNSHDPGSNPPQQPAADIPTPPLSDISSGAAEQAAILSSLISTSGDQDAKPDMSNKPVGNVLKIDPKTGTFGLPSKSKQSNKFSLIVTIGYGRDDAHREKLGKKIAQLLSDKPTKRRYQRRAKPSSLAEDEGKAGSKSLQSFFGGKTDDSTQTAQPEAQPAVPPKSPPRRRNTIFMSTPVSPRKTRDVFASTKPLVNWGSTKPIGTKIPGAMHPAWPCQDATHVRGGGTGQKVVASSQIGDDWISRKYKGQVTTVTAEDSALDYLTRRLDLMSIRGALPRDEDQFEPAPKELRQPTRLFESGRKLQRRITKELHSRRALAIDQLDSDDELGAVKAKNAHPAILRLYRGLETSLSAYDCSSCENLTWTHKYAPTNANEVLQAGREAPLLKQWLEALQVQSVDTGASESNAKARGKADRVPKKRKKNKLDDFIVDSDEDEEMDEVAENEEDWEPAGSGSRKKSIARRIPVEQSRVANSVIISGPHGCGKTAAVYAVAKELDFEVFEINSSTRRSGKDVLEKVGDMTRNHLVQQHQVEAPAVEPEAEDEVERDLKSGKQGTMTAFFKPKSGGASKKPNEPKKKDTSAKEDRKPGHKGQKQSLILLEEVDVLYDEDKQFWTTLMSLMAQSRRPFIITCNDESLVPIQSLHLHAIFRFSPPPIHLAVDTCLLVAANEGHALERSAVESLYVSRGYDLRATITELNYWCQIGVGDRRGGFDWFYLRWPKGSDVDEHGDVVRVISRDTYLRGMGWIGRDLLSASSNSLEREEEAMRQCWDSWRTPVGDWHNSLNMASCAAKLSVCTQGRGQDSHLAAYQQLCESLSDTDALSNGAFGIEFSDDLIDPTVPSMPSKSKEDYTVGRQLLEATMLTRPCDPSSDISLSLSSLARQDLLHHASQAKSDEACSILSPIGEKKSVSILESRFLYSQELLTRHDFSNAFDPIATSDGNLLSTYLDPSVFDRTMNIIVCDVAPWVRSIVAYDQSLMLERRKLSNLLSEGGQRKRMRNTRSAYSALEGGERRSTRRDNYFQGAINSKIVLDTGMKAWRDAAHAAIAVDKKEGVEEEHQRDTSPVSADSAHAESD